jgi:hypothetical protein
LAWKAAITIVLAILGALVAMLALTFGGVALYLWLELKLGIFADQLDGRNLLWRSVIRYGTSKICYWPLLMTLAVTRLQILDDVSNLCRRGMRDRLRLTPTGRFPPSRLERLRTQSTAVGWRPRV